MNKKSSDLKPTKKVPNNIKKNKSNLANSNVGTKPNFAENFNINLNSAYQDDTNGTNGIKQGRFFKDNKGNIIYETKQKNSKLIKE